MDDKGLKERVTYLENLIEKQKAEINRLNTGLSSALLCQPEDTALKSDEGNQEMMNTIMDNANVSITLMDYNGRFTFFNKQAEKYLRFPPEILRTKTVTEIFPEEGPSTLAEIRRIFNDKMPVLRDVSYNIGGKPYHFEINRLPLFNQKDEVYNVMSIAREITEIKYAQKISKIQHAIDSLQSIGETFEESLHILFDNLFQLDWVDAGGIYLVDDEKATLDLIYHRGLSENFIRQTSFYPLDSNHAIVAFKKLPRYMTKGSFLTATLENVIAEKISFIASLPLVHRDQVLGLLNLASRNVTDINLADRQAIENIAIKVANLIELIKTRVELDRMNNELNSKLKELGINQQLLLQKSRLESLGELSAGLAHEINQPLSVISLVMENVNYKLDQKATTKEYLKKKFNTITQNINKIRELIDHVRIFSRDQGAIMFEQVDVNNVISNALSMINSQLRHHRILITTELEKDLGYTMGNPSRLEQVLLNLFSNARDAVEEKEKQAGNEGMKMEILIRTDIESEKIVIKVRDNGAGISTENLNRIFNPFFTTKSVGHGTGLGLPIVYGIIREMKGEIMVKSDEGYFTEISISLPRYKNNVEKL